MKKQLIFYTTIMILMLVLCACDGNDATVGIPPASTNPTSSSKTDQPADPTLPTKQPAEPTRPGGCEDGHDFVGDADECSRCGIDYYSATLEFVFADTRDHYILTGIGSCDRREVIVPGIYRGVPVKKIGDRVFSGTQITKIVLPESIDEIGGGAFANCGSLKEINIPSGISVIREGTFQACELLEEIQFPEGLVTIEEHAFSECLSLKQIILPSGLKTIGQLAFAGCVAATVLEIPGTVTEIGRETFAQCRSLASLHIPGSIAVIPESAFASCKSLKQIQIGEGVTTIGRGAFRGCGFETLTLPDTVIGISSRAFMQCKSLCSISLPSGLKEMGFDVFVECDALQYSVYEGVKYIGNAENPYMVLVAAPDSSITCLTIHDQAQWIVSKRSYGKIYSDECVFPNLQSLYIGKNLAHIEDGIFTQTASLTDIRVSTENDVFHVKNDCIIETDSKTLVFATWSGMIPDDGSVTAIYDLAFALQQERKIIIIPEAVTAIGADVFEGCPNLEALVIGSNVIFIDHDILIYCKKFSRIYYMGTPEDWEEIEIIGKYGGIGGNVELMNATRYYYSETQPTEPGNYWHYVDGVPTPWE